jgi:hypothetical protein
LGLKFRPLRTYDWGVTSPLKSTNPYGIRVVADRAPVREDAMTAFERASRKAETGISGLTKPRRRSTATDTRKRAK